MRVFFSWQSDLTDERKFIRKQLQKICDELDIEYDEDTRNTGSAEFVTDILLRKIKNSTVFVADLTPVGKTGDNTKKLANPNVCFELGYAESQLGRSQIVITYNDALADFDDLPFDLSKRNTVRFKLPMEKGMEKGYYKKMRQTIAAAIDSYDSSTKLLNVGEKPLNKYEKTLLYWGINKGGGLISEAWRKEEGLRLAGDKELSIGDNRFWYESNTFFYKHYDGRQSALFHNALGSLINRGYVAAQKEVENKAWPSVTDGKMWAVTEEGEVIARSINIDEIYGLVIHPEKKEN